MKITFSKNAWIEYSNWLEEDRKIQKKINALLKDIIRNPYDGLGKPEQLKHNFSGIWSRRITDEHRLTYRILDEEVEIIKCKYHYSK